VPADEACFVVWRRSPGKKPTMPDAVLLRFAQQEVVYLLRALQIPAIAGANAASLGKLDADHIALAMADADRALRAREVVHADGPDARQVDPVVAGLLRAGAGAQYTALLDSQNAKGTRRLVYTFADYAIVEHDQPEPGVHQFVAFATIEDTSKRLSALLAMEGATPGAGEARRLSPPRWDAARAVSEKDLARTQQILAEELPSTTADGLASTLAHATAQLHVALWRGTVDETQPREPHATLAAFAGAGGLFVVASAASGATGASTAPLDVLPATPELAARRVREMLKPALAVLRTDRAAAQ